MAVINAVSKTGSEITEDTLLELITIYAHGNKDFHKTILPVIADKIKLISIKSLHKAIECKNIFCIEFVCQTLIERGVPVDQGLVASTFVKFTEYSFGYDASNTEYAISVVINAVRKTNQKISEEILLNQSCSKIWEDDKYQALFKIILTAIVDTKGAVSVALLEKTIRKYNPNPVYVKQICDELISRKISVTEGHIIQAINAIYFITPSHDKAIKAVINAVVSSGNPITESTLNRVMNGGPRLQYVIDGMKATPGSLSTEPLRAMLENNEKYSEKILGLYVKYTQIERLQLRKSLLYWL
ncbi:MAG: hypothetical protein HWD59_01520 [Coxiellaceae bacterium]|nr:MAG: hypothetical protein HWD59_01520 [Coxiellaceae bacterium]